LAPLFIFILFSEHPQPQRVNTVIFEEN